MAAPLSFLNEVIRAPTSRYFYQYGATIQVRYSLPPPVVERIQPAPSICADKTTTLTVNPLVPNTTGLTYEWQYSTRRDLLGRYIWNPLENSASPDYSFTPSATIFSAGITTNTTVTFRVRSKSSELTSNWSTPKAYSFSPPGPKIASVTFEPSCPTRNGIANPTGKIILSGISGLGSYKYILRNGHNKTLPCVPDGSDPNNRCFDLANMANPSGAFSGPAYEITGIPPGAYTLWVINNGANQGVCGFVKPDVTIEAIPTLTLAAPAVTHVTCHGAKEGSITIASSGGRPNLTYTLRNARQLANEFDIIPYETGFPFVELYQNQTNLSEKTILETKIYSNASGFRLKRGSRNRCGSSRFIERSF